MSPGPDPQDWHRRLVEGLLQPRAYPHPVARVRLIETHISSILLTGDYAYKLKKPLDLGFLDFRDPARRRHYCAEELRLNQRLAPELYLGLATVNGELDVPRVDGAGPVLETAVRMRQFDPEQGLDRLQQRGLLDGPLLDQFIDELVDFHQRAECAAAPSEYGSPEAVLEPMLENLRQIRRQLGPATPRDRLDALERCTLARWHGLQPDIVERRARGRVRECHGDLHLGNLVLVDGRVRAFDALEFSARLRWIDVASELAFLTMDLRDRGAPALANRCLNRYLEAGGDWDAAPLIDWYQMYRAMVRAKIAAIRGAQEQLEPDERRRQSTLLADYLALAEFFAEPRRPQLVLTQGLSGAGKSYLSQGLVERLGALRLRSDAERRRTPGLPAAPQLRYSPGNIDRVYRHLASLAARLLEAGFPVVVDAAFLRRDQRRPFLELARARGLDCTLLRVTAPRALMLARLTERQRSGQDPSEATAAVLERQIAAQEAPDASERAQARCLEVINDGREDPWAQLPEEWSTA